ncbi:galactose ABC transporter substrate-binding protein [Carnobacterium sp.]|uniref:galactose ABC transporter substrate-binding protein n=1 Tax=Carnobacterium sp. TaxID=48221 RepID=UPI003C7387D6
MSKFKRFLLGSAALLTMSTLVACGNSDSEEGSDSSGSGEKIGVAFYKYDDTYISSVRQALEDASKGEKDVELLLNDSKGDQATQNDQIDVLIQKGVKVLLVNVVDTGAAQTVIDKASAADIPVIFFNREPDADVLAGYDKARFVGTRPEEAGVIQGEMVAELWKADKTLDKNGDGVLSYVMLMGDADNPEAIARTKFSVSTIKDAGIEVKEIGQQVANWDADKANTAVSAWLSREGDNIEVVLANNDSMASGAISALQSGGYNNGEDKYIPVFGVDATDEAVDLISKNYMSGTVKQDAVGMAEAIFALGVNATQGKDYIEGTDYEYDDTGISIRIPYQAYSGKE